MGGKRSICLFHHQDPENQDGGKFILRLSVKGRSTERAWEDLLLAFIGGQFDLPSDEVCGIALSVRQVKDVISVWNKHATNDNYKKVINDTVRGILQLPSHILLEYKSHSNSVSKKDTGTELKK